MIPPITEIIKSIENNNQKPKFEGRFGKVYLLTIDSECYALKEINRKSNTGLTKPSKVEMELREIKILQELQPHCSKKNVICYKDSHVTQEKIYILTEFIQGPTLNEYLENMNNLTKDQICNIALKLFQGIDIIHNAGFIHGDLKPDNLILRLDNEIVSSIVFIDFGLSCSLSQCTDFKDLGCLFDNPFHGSPYSTPPSIPGKDFTRGLKLYMEMEKIKNIDFKKNPADKDQDQINKECPLLFEFLKKKDLWAIGMMIIELVTSNYPTEEVIGDELREKFQKKGMEKVYDFIISDIFDLTHNKQIKWSENC